MDIRRASEESVELLHVLPHNSIYRTVIWCVFCSRFSATGVSDLALISQWAVRAIFGLVQLVLYGEEFLYVKSNLPTF